MCSGWRKWAGVVCVVGVFSLINASAATAGESAVGASQGLEALLFEEIPMVITSTLKSQKATEAPSAIHVLSGEEIRKRGYRTLKDMVVDIPGWEDVSDANEIIAAVRGMYASSTNKILVMINGHRMNDLNLGRYNLDQFLGTDVIERVELIKGPGSVLYGTGALIGVINVITKKGSDLNGLMVSNRDTIYPHTTDVETGLTWGGKKGDVETILNLTYLNAEGDEIEQASYLNKPLAGTQPVNGRIYYNKYPDNWSLFSSTQYKDLSVDFRREHYARATPRSPNISYYIWDNEPIKPQYQEDITYLDVKYAIPFSETAKLTFNPGVTLYRLDELSWISSYGADLMPPYGTRSGQKTQYEQYQIKATYDHQLLDNLNFILGFDSIIADFSDMRGVSGSTGESFSVVETDEGHWVLAGGFFQFLWSPLEKLELTLSGRYDTFQHLADPKFIKRLGAVYQFTQDISTKLLYGESFLPPQWAHKKQVTAGAWSSNSSLKPEVFNGWDWIVEYNRHGARLAVDLFRNRLKNLITAVGTSYFNIGETTYQGLEVEGAYPIVKQLRAEGSYSFVKNEGNTSDVYLVGTQIKQIPRNIFRAGLTYTPWKNFDLMAWGRAYSKVLTSDSITGETRIKPWATMDLSASYKIKQWDLQCAVTNVLDKYYELGGSVNRPMARPGRAFEISARYTF